mmetsp:Transcript_4532/g.15942  ORF Transcript_4532/g.15942 Transcript_4532/m.15942 type:complete len:728 (-) Transcript_4532:26-2209(-)
MAESSDDSDRLLDSGDLISGDYGSTAAAVTPGAEMDDEEELEEMAGAKDEPDVSDISSYYKKKKEKRTPEEWLALIAGQKWLFLVFLLSLVCLLVLFVFSDDWHSMDWKGWASVIVTDITLFVLIANWYPPAFVFLAAMSVCYGIALVDSTDAFEGFSNTGVITVGVMFIVAKAVEVSDVLRYVVKYLLRQPKSLVIAMLRLCVPVAVVSAFINNTPVVAMMIPVVQNWAVQCRLPVSRLMMPLSYAAIMGGTCTIIGTSTNLIVQGLVEDAYPDTSIGFFEVGLAGVPCAVMSILYMLIFARWLLPDNDPEALDTAPKPAGEQGDGPSQRKMYTCSVRVTKSSNLIGKTIADSGLSQLEGLRLISVTRKDGTPVGPAVMQADNVLEVPSVEDDVDSETVIESGDVLFFYGMLRHLHIVYSIDGLVPATTQIAKIDGKRHARVLVEVVVSPFAEFVGKTVRNSEFRTTYNAVIIAAYRFNERLVRRVGDIVLKGGDTLLLEATTDFLKYHASDTDFALVHEVSAKSTTPRRVSFNMFFVVILALIMVTLAALQLYDILPGALLISCVYVIMGCITWKQALGSVQGDTLLVIAAAFGLGNALQDTGAATVISNSLINIFYIAGDIGVLFGLYLATAVLSAVISNGATVTLMFPIAQGFLDQTTLTVESIAFTLMLAASCCYSTPVGYQTNLMVLGPGGYTTGDFLKFGVPLTVINMVLAVVLIYLIWN